MAAMGIGVVLYVADLDGMTSFYEDCFEMSRLDIPGDSFRVLSRDQFDLSLVTTPEAIAAGLEPAIPRRRRVDSPTKLAFDVASVETLRPLITAAGGQVDPAEEGWSWRGVAVAIRHSD